MPDGTIKWGVLGTASIAAGCTIPGMQKAGTCELYAIAGRSPSKAESFKERFGFKKAYEGYDALLADPEVQAVYIPLPNDIHCEWVIRALNAGKHVLCEKPIALNETELRRMYKAARDNGVILRSVSAESNYTLELEQLNRCIRGEAKPHISEVFSIKNMRLLDRILDKVGYTAVREEYILDNGVAIPAVGFGSYQSTDGNGKAVIREALQAGYRYIDTASFYFNEEEIGEAIKESGIRREDIFLCSKVWPEAFGREETLKAFEESCARLKTDYLDMYLLHWPRLSPDDDEWITAVKEAWKALEKLYDSGRIRAIGVSNFMPHHLRALLKEARIRPMVDQLELHVGYMQEYALGYLRQEGILPQAWSPLGRARVINDEYVARIAAKYGRSNAQILLRYLLERGIPVIPKTSDTERMKENMDIFDFKLTDDDISYLSCLPERGWSGEHPDLPRP